MPTITITISKSETLVIVLIILLLLSLGLTVMALRGEETKALESKASPMSSSANSTEPHTVLMELPKNLPVPMQPHPSCFLRLYYMLPRSNVYNGNSTWANAAMGGAGSGPYLQTLQDINGDNLPDYVFAMNQTFAGTNELGSQHFGCVYLNNGSGWTKAYECYAQTQTDVQTGNILQQSYAGDCAGPPSKN